MTQLICDDCKFAEPGRYGKTVWCPILERDTEVDGPCQVSRQGLLQKVRMVEPLRDQADSLPARIYELEERRDLLEQQEWDDLYNHDIWRKRWDVEDKIEALQQKADELNAEVAKWTDAIRELWSHAATSRKCPKCDYIPLDSTDRYCQMCGSTLLLRPKRKVGR